ncbi:hypothetical protein ABPG73_018611 [Tetrahymena malaccensis]
MRNTQDKNKIMFDIQEDKIQKQNESNNIINIDKQENTLELNVNCMYSMENEQNDQVNHLPNFQVKLKGSQQFSQSNQCEFNPFDISNFQKRQSSYQNKSNKCDQEDIIKFHDESKLQDEQLVLQYQESNNQSQNQSLIQYQTLQKMPPQNILLSNENTNQINFNASPIPKAIDSKKQLKTKPSTENCQNKTQTGYTIENQSSNFVSKIDKQKTIQIESISKQNLQIITKQNLSSKIQEPKSLELSTQQTKIIYEQIANDLNIFSLYQDIIFLKKAVMILFNNEQLAAIKHLGCSQIYLDLIRDKIDVDLQKINQLRREKKINFLDEQFIIYQSQKLQQQQTEQLLIRIQNKLNISEIDQRIVSSLP